MLRYLYLNQKGKLILFVVFSLLSSLFEIALSYVMLQSVDLAVSGQLSDALNYGLWFALYIACQQSSYEEPQGRRTRNCSQTCDRIIHDPS